MKLEENKLKELKTILSLVSTNKEKNYPLLLKFEKENPAELYYLEIVISETNSDNDMIELILERVKHFNFLDQIEPWTRKIIQNLDLQNVQSFFSEYLRCNPLKSSLFPVMIDEISKMKIISFHVETTLNFLEFMTSDYKSDPNMLTFFIKVIKLITERQEKSRYRILNLIFSIFFSKNLEGMKEKFDFLWPYSKFILLEFDNSEDYFDLIFTVFSLIPSEDALKIFEKILFEFTQPLNRDLAFHFFIFIFQNFNENYEEYSQRYL
jgi:hypothetical protein